MLPSRVEEHYDLARQRIEARGAVTLESIARGAGQPEILLDGEATPGLRDEVVDLQRRANDLLGREAIPTPVAGMPPHQFPQRGRDVGGTQLTPYSD